MNKIVLGLVAVGLLSLGTLFYVISRPALEAPPVGSVVSNNLPDRYFSVGGVNYDYVRVPFSATSSVPCVIRPFQGHATSTLTSFTITASSTTQFGAQTFDVSTTTATGGYGSSTPAFIFAASFGNAQNNIAWSPNATTTYGSVLGTSPGTPNGTSGFIIKPTEFVTMRYATNTPSALVPATLYPAGACSAVFRQI